MENANTWVQPTRFTGDYPTGFSGYTFLDYDPSFGAYHPGEDYNWSEHQGGNEDLGQDVKAAGSGIVVHASDATTGYGKLVVIKHQLGYNLKRFVKDTYGIDTNEIYSLYAHLDQWSVKVGDSVKAGDRIGSVGKTGTTWAHLHFELYAPIGDLLKTDWRFYPSVAKGWTKEKTKQYYLPAYSFIEATKQIDDLADSYMGKPREYWLQVEKDRENLMKQVGTKDKEWASKMDLQRIDYEKRISTLDASMLTLTKEKNDAVGLSEKQVKDFAKKETDYKKEIEDLKIKVSQLIDDNSDNYQFWEAVQIAVTIALKKLKLKV